MSKILYVTATIGSSLQVGIYRMFHLVVLNISAFQLLVSIAAVLNLLA